MLGADVVVPRPGMVITKDTTLQPGVYYFDSGEGLEIAASNITIDGNGAVIVGPGTLDKGIESFVGIGIHSKGYSGVVLKNFVLKGFRNGLLVEDGENWTIENNDFSNNYHDPNYGWGDGPMYGAVLLIRVHNSVIRKNVGHNNWNGLDLRYSSHNTIEGNDFSHCSNVCLRMWNASNNTISDNNFSYGIRISPGEVHARDSSSLLVESGSDNNRFYRNDFTHGGDGIFIRVLNGWVSTGNYFEANDCSYANNNAVESWSPGNTYVRNIANYSSYGFWLGGSDNTVLIGNQVRYNGGYNGETPNNAPESFGNAGIAVVNGSSSHFVLRSNDVQFNNGPGIAIGYKADYPAYHWIIEQNTIKNNRNDPRGYKGYGIYVKNAKWIDIGGNDTSDNDAEAVFIDSNVSDVFIREATLQDQPPTVTAEISAPIVKVGEEIVLDASKSTDATGRALNYRWDLGDGNLAATERVAHTYSQPGFYRVGLTVNNGRLANLAFFNLYVIEQGEEIGTDRDVSEWDIISDDPNVNVINCSDSIQGGTSIQVVAGVGQDHTLIYPKSKQLAMDLSCKSTLSFWFKYHAETYGNDKHKRPIVRLHQDESNYFAYRPKVNYFLEKLWAPVSEEKNGWMRIEIPLTKAGDLWERDQAGNPSLECINYIAINEGPSESALSVFLIDGLQVR